MTLELESTARSSASVPGCATAVLAEASHLNPELRTGWCECSQASTKRVAQAAKKQAPKFGTQRTSRPVQVGNVPHDLCASTAVASECIAAQLPVLRDRIAAPWSGTQSEPFCLGPAQGAKQMQKKAQFGTQRVAQKAKSAAKPVAKAAQRAAPSGGLFGRRPGEEQATLR